MLMALIREMRPKQWTKNALVFAGIVFDGQLFIAESLLRVIAAFILLCFISSSIYIVNDIVDVEADRQHPRKRFRPIAAGELPIPVAWAAALIFMIGSVVGAYLLDWRFALILVIYVLIHVAYSYRLKHVVILDIFAVAAGFVLRVASGVVVISVMAFSPWLYACTGLLSLFLVIGKRRGEMLELLSGEMEKTRRVLEDYNMALLDEMLRLVVFGTFVAYLIYTIESPSVLLAGTNSALITVPFVLYALFRYLYLIHVRGEGSAPDEVLLKDRALQVSIALWGLSFLVILYVLPSVR